MDRVAAALAEHVPKGRFPGTHRAVAPEETLARVRPLMPVMGITRIANVTGLDRVGLPVTVVSRPNARSLAVSQGKGLDLAAARASGLMEAVEGFHAERITLPLKLASYEELRYTHRCVDPLELPRLPVSRYHRDQVIHWIEGYDLIGAEPVWVPYDAVHLNLTVSFDRHPAGLVISSNGLASGNHLLEAVSHGICEVIERDATTLWYQLAPAARDATRLDLDGVADATVRGVLERFERAGVLLGVWEVTSDVGVPAFLCRSVDVADTALRRLCYSETMGCHPVREIALLRALTEAAQARLTWIAGSRDDCFPEHYAWMRDPDLNERHRAEIRAPGPRRSLAGCPSWEAETFHEDVAWLLGRLRAAGIARVVVVDLTRPEFRLPVARVVIPGLEGMLNRAIYAPGARARRLTGAAGAPVADGGTPHGVVGRGGR